MNIAILLAGGKGSRAGTQIPKQLLLLDHRPLILHSFETFLKTNAFDKILIVSHPHTENTIKNHLGSSPYTLIPGGETRFFSTCNALNYLDSPPNKTHVVIHDVARPFVTKHIIEEHLKALKEYEAVNTAIPSTNSLIISKDGLHSDKSLDRHTVYQVQTPQSFHLTPLKEAFQKAILDKKSHLFTDDCSTFQHYHKSPIKIVNGSEKNIKITHPQDISIAQAILQEEL